jgi:hypothetical protein
MNRNITTGWVSRSVIIFLVLFGCVSALADDPKPKQQRSPVTEDLSQGATFTFKIATDVPEFTFKVIPDVQKPDQYGNPTTIIQDVQVFAGASSQRLQNLEDCEWEGMEAPPKGSDWFRAEDMNFDGYKDVYLLTNWGATGNQLGCIWLYDPASGQFEYSKEFSDLGTLAIDPATKTITTHGNGGIAGRVFRAGKYIVQDNRPVLIITVAQDYDFKTKKYHCIVQQRHEGRLVTIRDVWGRAEKRLRSPM